MDWDDHKLENLSATETNQQKYLVEVPVSVASAAVNPLPGAQVLGKGTMDEGLLGRI